MRYKAMGQNRGHRLSVPQFAGGLNTSADPSLIDDDELAEVCNLSWKRGVLETRGAVRAIGEDPLISCDGYSAVVDGILRRPIEIGGEPCTVVLSAATDTETASADVTVQVVTLGGECLKTYTMTSAGTGEFSFAIAPCDPELHGGTFLLYHANGVYMPDDDTGTMVLVGEDKLYAPLVMVNGTSFSAYDDTALTSALANGVMYEGFNMLTHRYRAQFTPLGAEGTNAGEGYGLPTRLQLHSEVVMDIVSAKGNVTVEMTVGGEPVGFNIGAILYTAQAHADGYVKLAPPLPASTVSNTVTITCVREDDPIQRMTTTRARLATWFGGTQNKLGGTRLFLGGFGNAKLMWSDVNDPFYFPENNYMYVGDLSQKITALEKQGDMLVIFKEREMFYTTYVQGEIDAEAVIEGTNVDVTAAQAYFPLTQLSPSIGCRCSDSIALCRDRLVWMDKDARIYTLVVSGAYSERNVREIGAKVRPFLLENTTESQRATASAADHDSKYRLMIGRWMAEFDYNETGFVNVSGYASGERAARNIAWFVHRFDGLASNAVQTLVSNGADKALLISTSKIANGIMSYYLTRTLYAVDAAGDDRYVSFNADLNPTVTELPIAVSLTTKTYELGDPAVCKRLDALYPSLEAENAVIRVIADGNVPTSGRRYRSTDTNAHLVIPGVKRCRSFAVVIEATGTLRVKGLRLQYTPFGTVR